MAITSTNTRIGLRAVINSLMEEGVDNIYLRLYIDGCVVVAGFNQVFIIDDAGEVQSFLTDDRREILHYAIHSANLTEFTEKARFVLH